LASAEAFHRFKTFRLIGKVDCSPSERNEGYFFNGILGQRRKSFDFCDLAKNPSICSLHAIGKGKLQKRGKPEEK